MVNCKKCFYIARKGRCSCPDGVYIERVCIWRNRDDNCKEYIQGVGLTDRLKILEGNSGIVSEVALDMTALVLSLISYR
jgi:hypothetical protein